MVRLWAGILGKIRLHNPRSSTSPRWRPGHPLLLPSWVGRNSSWIQTFGSYPSLWRKTSIWVEFPFGSCSGLLQEKLWIALVRAANFLANRMIGHRRTRDLFLLKCIFDHCSSRLLRSAVILNRDPTAIDRITIKIPLDWAPVISYQVKILANWSKWIAPGQMLKLSNDLMVKIMSFGCSVLYFVLFWFVVFLLYLIFLKKYFIKEFV